MDQHLVGHWPLPIWLTTALVLLLGLVAWGSYRWPFAGRLLRRRLNSTGEHAFSSADASRFAPPAERLLSGSELFRLGLASLRWLSLVIVLVMLGGWKWQSLQLAPPRLVVLLDDSASMSGLPRSDAMGDTPQPELPQPTWGWPAAQQWLLADDARNLRTLSARYQLRVGLVADSLRWLSDPYPSNEPPPVDAWVKKLEQIRPERSGSRLGDGLVAAAAQLQDHPPAAVVLISDGIVTDGLSLEEAGELLGRRTVPLWLLQTADPDPQLPIKVGPLLGPSHVLLGDRVTLSASVRLPPSDGGWLDVKLVDRIDSQPLASHRLELPTGGGDRTCQWQFTPRQAGHLRLGVELERLPTGGSNSPNPDSPSPQSAYLQSVDSGRRRWSLERSGQTVDHDLRVRDEPLRVLLVQSEPSYEFRFLKSWLERAHRGESRAVAGTAPVSWLGQADAGYARQDRTATESLPSSREALRQFDVVVLGDVDPDDLPRAFQPALQEFVQLDGGGLIVIAGPSAMPLKYADQPLAKLLPIVIAPGRVTAWPTPISWQPTPMGLRLAPFQIAPEMLAAPLHGSDLGWPELPLQRWHQQPLLPRPAAQVLARGLGERLSESAGKGEGGERLSGANVTELPLVVSHYFGRGLVVYQASDETFRWMANELSQRYYDQYWGGMLRWLSQPGTERHETSTRWSIEPRKPGPGESVTVTARLPATALERLQTDQPRLELAAVSGTDRVAIRLVDLLRSEGESGRFEAQLPGLSRGEYQVRWESPPLDQPPDSIGWLVEPRDLEGSLRIADRNELERAAELSGGRWLQLADAEQLTDLLPAGSPQPVGLGPARSLWNHPLVVGTLVLLLSVEWLGRRRCGLR